MPLWELSPVDLLDAAWEASSYRGKVIVRARDEQDARDAAERAFAVKTRFKPGAGITAPPWKRRALVTAAICTDARYAAEGPREILYPAPL
jgi:hypothetical protein